MSATKGTSSDSQMDKRQLKNTINKNWGNMTRSEHSYPSTASMESPNTTKTKENDLASNLIKMIEAFKK